MNPFSGEDVENMALTGLMYESLFIAGDDFSPVPLLCKSYTTTDFMIYTFRIQSEIAFSDESLLGAEDVAYSILAAKDCERYALRLRSVAAVLVIDDLTLELTLRAPNNKFPVLLDIPIIKDGTARYNYPIGSGPYRFDERRGDRLVANTAYRDYAELPVKTVYLTECTNTGLIEKFTDRDIDLYLDDPADIFEFNVRSDHETRYYNTTTLQYLGFSRRSEPLKDSSIRRAIGLLADRDAIVRDILAGHALPAPLALPSVYSLYDRAWEQKATDPILEVSAIFAFVGLQDTDSDAYLEYPAGDGFLPFSIDFIVNIENGYKVAAAEQIAAAAERVGININLRKLPWEDFTAALKSGDFDIFFGETRLSADFDFSPLISPGGALDFGHIGSESYGGFVEAFRLAKSEEVALLAAKQLCTEIYANAPFVPLCYMQYAVHTHRGAVSGVHPSQSNIYCDMADWIIDLT
jgi:peptide/nickel transport system substrate-binding protein